MGTSTKILGEGLEVRQCVVKSTSLQVAPEAVLHEVEMGGTRNKYPNRVDYMTEMYCCKSKHNECAGMLGMPRLWKVC